MKARLIEHEQFRLYVTSETNPDDEYLVDLESFDFNGECGCPHFEKKLLPKLSSGEIRTGECKHIPVAREFWQKTVGRLIVAKEKETQGDLDNRVSRPSSTTQTQIQAPASENDPF